MRYGDSSLPETKQTPGWLLFCKQNDSSSLEKAVSRQCFSMSGAALRTLWSTGKLHFCRLGAVVLSDDKLQAVSF